MTYQCELTEVPAQPVLSIRTRAAVSDLPQVLGKAFGAIMQYLGEAGEHPAGAPFVAYYNMDMQDLDLEIGFPVARTLPGKEEVKPGEIPAGKQAACLHKGPYDQVGGAYNALTQWVQEKGYTPTGVAYEFYLNDPQTTPAAGLLTRVVFPLEMAKS
jgi:effector-binding domain-containing protein